jgi:hypothetical protein
MLEIPPRLLEKVSVLVPPFPSTLLPAAEVYLGTFVSLTSRQLDLRPGSRPFLRRCGFLLPPWKGLVSRLGQRGLITYLRHIQGCPRRQDDELSHQGGFRQRLSVGTQSGELLS